MAMFAPDEMEEPPEDECDVCGMPVDECECFEDDDEEGNAL
jgi:hypothetical protein